MVHSCHAILAENSREATTLNTAAGSVHKFLELAREGKTLDLCDLPHDWVLKASCRFECGVAENETAFGWNSKTKSNFGVHSETSNTVLNPLSGLNKSCKRYQFPSQTIPSEHVVANSSGLILLLRLYAGHYDQE